MNALAPAADIDIVELTLADVQEGFASGRFTSEQLTAAHLQRIERFEPYYNAFTFMNPTALDDARAIDARRAAGEVLGPLAGGQMAAQFGMRSVFVVGAAVLGLNALNVLRLPAAGAPREPRARRSWELPSN